VKQIYVDSYYPRGYSRWMQKIYDILSHPRQKEIETRVKIIEFFDEYGADAARKAFGKSRSTIYLWKQKLKDSGGKLSSLAPGDRAPLNKRKRRHDPFIDQFIVDYRTLHPGVDKLTITPVLKAACESRGIKQPSESTVGRIIADLKANGRLPKKSRVTINGRTGRLHEKQLRKVMKKSRRKGFHPRLPGELIEIDTIDIFVDGLKRYLITAVDLPTRFAFAYIYKTGSSASARDFLDKLNWVTPFKVSRVQTDNGSEFLKHFARAACSQGIIHYFNYPRHPQSNGHLERFNRTIKEQFAYYHIDCIDEPEDFNRPLMEYLIWYNTERVHRAIGKVPPLRYYLDEFIANPKKSNMYWTLTNTFVLSAERL
jgi:putative transposase